ncbi:hypothetical protein [Chitinophaga sancti]|nr:hypothetical protein [Chitinophaga sancti]WQD59635.1 hypothetical protein U0033_17245 [Chitinophaga sancti]WQG88234.1 hypothetical protein SR876_25220 [Chitinophaga sancti]
MSKYHENINPTWVVFIAVSALLLPIFIIEMGVLKYTKGVWTYIIEDPFIHMSIAKNLVLHHIWGPTPYEFCSSSSSILYPILIALLFKVFGFYTIIPFAINLIASLVLIIILQRWLNQNRIKPIGQIFILLSLIFLTPLPVLVILGMEHTLHLLISFLFIDYLAKYLGSYGSDVSDRYILGKILVLGCLLTSIRYEGVFIIVIGFSILLFRKLYLRSLLLLFISIAPIVLFGFYSISKGGLFLPNSVLMKSSGIPHDLISFTEFISEGVWVKLYSTAYNWSQIVPKQTLLLLPLSYVLFIASSRNKMYYHFGIFILFGTIITHIFFGRMGWFFRYEAYFVGLTIIYIHSFILTSKIDNNIFSWEWSKMILISIGLFLVIPFIFRSWDAFRFTSDACKYTFNRNYLVGMFLHEYYDNTNTAINDLGVIAYYNKGNNLDFGGLGNTDVTKSVKGNYNTLDFYCKKLEERKVTLAVLFDEYCLPLQKARWVKVASWHSAYHINYFNTDFQLYAIDSTLALELKHNLNSFKSKLSDDIKIQYYN